MIVFSGLEFMFRFLPIFLLAYYLTPARFRDYVLFGGSFIFYASGEPIFVWVLLGLTLINYFLANQDDLLTLAVLVLDIGVLVGCKIAALAIPSFTLPIGISFYIFKMISFQADLYRGKLRRRPGFIQVAAYFTMFPQIAEGPIMRYGEGRFSAKRGHEVSITLLDDGLTFFIMGLAMKVLIADRIGILWNEIVKIGFESISTPLAWLGAFGYSFQLYFDFWGYSLMAAGLGRMLGFPFIHNFLDPYAANGIADFYRRWHATLGSFFRDYVYIPLGGSREGDGKTIRNLLIVWALTGLWHGGTVNFLIWGLVLGLLIIYEKFVVANLMERIPILGHLHVWFFIPLTWVIFAISDLGKLGTYFSRLFPFFGAAGGVVNPGDFMMYLKMFWPFFLASVLLCIPAISNTLIDWRKKLPIRIILIALLWVCVYMAVTSAGNPFMYFNF